MRSLLFILSFFTMTLTHAQFSNKRQLLIFGAPQSAMVKQQLALLDKDAKGLQERDMQIKLAAGTPYLYKEYRVPTTEAFVVLLVGKDCGEKFRSQKPATTKDLFGIIDAMPMRRSEMRGIKDN